jgi:hypothetical protein
MSAPPPLSSKIRRWEHRAAIARLINAKAAREKAAFDISGVSMGKHLHRLSQIDPDDETGTCLTCGAGVPVRFRKSTGQWVCRKQDQRTCHKEAGWIADRRRMAAEQNNKCAICQQERPLVLDHCHKSGKRRSALCTCCNAGIGMFRDDPALLQRAIAYLERHRS